MTTDRALLKHFLAALAYRTRKAVNRAPESFARYRVAPGVRTPMELIHHMSGVLSYALQQFVDLDPWIDPLDTWQEELDRFHSILTRLGEQLDAGSNFRDSSPEQLLQGPFADAMTHAGQIALIRRLSGHPIPPENFHQAAITGDNLGEAQPPPVSPDREWFDAEGRPQAAPEE